MGEGRSGTSQTDWRVLKIQSLIGSGQLEVDDVTGRRYRWKVEVEAWKTYDEARKKPVLSLITIGRKEE